MPHVALEDSRCLTEDTGAVEDLPWGAGVKLLPLGGALLQMELLEGEDMWVFLVAAEAWVAFWPDFSFGRRKKKGSKGFFLFLLVCAILKRGDRKLNYKAQKTPSGKQHEIRR